MPTLTWIIVFGAWILCLGLTLLSYFFSGKEDGEP
jgi:hypothetical protein